jgi:hypothetical protein
MRSVKTILLPAFMLIAITGYVNAQCKAFAKRECLPKLISYTHDGNYQVKKPNYIKLSIPIWITGFQ